MRAAWLLMVASPLALEAQRSVEKNRLISTTLPNAVLEVDPNFSYAGTQRFELYGVANAEQHFFVELDGTRIKRLLWIQYEGYFPSNTNTYNYRDETITHSGRSWHRRINAARVSDEGRQDSDGARARAFLRAKGWSVGADVLLERLVWLLDTPPRNELMIIYMEDLVDQGLTTADFSEAGRARDRWAEVRDAFHARALKAFQVVGR